MKKLIMFALAIAIASAAFCEEEHKFWLRDREGDRYVYVYDIIVSDYWATNSDGQSEHRMYVQYTIKGLPDHLAAYPVFYWYINDGKVTKDIGYYTYRLTNGDRLIFKDFLIDGQLMSYRFCCPLDTSVNPDTYSDKYYVTIAHVARTAWGIYSCKFFNNIYAPGTVIRIR